jgi:hypothetical protein
MTAVDGHGDFRLGGQLVSVRRAWESARPRPRSGRTTPDAALVSRRHRRQPGNTGVDARVRASARRCRRSSPGLDRVPRGRWQRSRGGGLRGRTHEFGVGCGERAHKCGVGPHAFWLPNAHPEQLGGRARPPEVVYRSTDAPLRTDRRSARRRRSVRAAGRRPPRGRPVAAAASRPRSDRNRSTSTTCPTGSNHDRREPAGATTRAESGPKAGRDSLGWPHRDGLKWLHLDGVSASCDGADSAWSGLVPSVM